MNKTPVSEINAEEFANFIQQEKDQLKEIEGDIKDAKRRISAAKNGGPKKRNANKKAESDGSDISDEA